MIDLKKYLLQKKSVLEFDNLEIDLDRVISNRKRVLSKAKDALRDHLELQFDEALKNFYCREIPADRNKIF